MNGLRQSMSLRRSTWSLLCVAALSAAPPALAQVRPAPTAAKPPVQAARPTAPATSPSAPPADTAPQAGAPVPGNPDYAPDAAAAPQVIAPPPLPPAVWDVVSAQDLLYYIQQIGREGLEPAD